MNKDRRATSNCKKCLIRAYLKNLISFIANITENNRKLIRNYITHTIEISYYRLKLYMTENKLEIGTI